MRICWMGKNDEEMAGEPPLPPLSRTHQYWRRRWYLMAAPPTEFRRQSTRYSCWIARRVAGHPDVHRLSATIQARQSSDGCLFWSMNTRLRGLSWNLQLDKQNRKILYLLCGPCWRHQFFFWLTWSFCNVIASSRHWDLPLTPGFGKAFTQLSQQRLVEPWPGLLNDW